MTLTKAGALAGAIVACLGLGQMIVPSYLYPAHRGYVQDEFGQSIRMTKSLFLTDLQRNIAHYNKQVCYGTHTQDDLDELADAYHSYSELTSDVHYFDGASIEDICRKLRIPLSQE